jgi:hypothetical protein
MNKAKRIVGVLLLLSVAGCETTVGRTDRLSTATASSSMPSQVVSIRLDNVSDGLSFPPPAGANRVLTATIQGGAVESVWVATNATSPARVPLTKVDKGEYEVNLYGQEVCDLLGSHPSDGEFRVFAKTANGEIVQSVAVCYSMRVPPKRLDFPWDRATVTIYQRCSRGLPGSHGNLMLHIGDITAGQVLVSVYGETHEPLIDMVSLRQGDTVRLPLAEEEYVLVLDRLVNVLIGRDYAVFSLVSPDAWQREEIDRLLTVIQESDLTFIRAGQEMTGAAFAAHLRQKLAVAKRDVLSVDQFIDQVASRSSTSGGAYQVRLAGGDIVDAAGWLREQVAHARPDQPDDTDSPVQKPNED